MISFNVERFTNEDTNEDYMSFVSSLIIENMQMNTYFALKQADMLCESYITEAEGKGFFKRIGEWILKLWNDFRQWFKEKRKAIMDKINGFGKGKSSTNNASKESKPISSEVGKESIIVKGIGGRGTILIDDIIDHEIFKADDYIIGSYVNKVDEIKDITVDDIKSQILKDSKLKINSFDEINKDLFIVERNMTVADLDRNLGSSNSDLKYYESCVKLLDRHFRQVEASIKATRNKIEEMQKMYVYSQSDKVTQDILDEYNESVDRLSIIAKYLLKRVNAILEFSTKITNSLTQALNECIGSINAAVNKYGINI